MFRAPFIATLATSKRQWIEVDVTTYSLGKKATGRGYVSVQYPGLGQRDSAAGRGSRATPNVFRSNLKKYTRQSDLIVSGSGIVVIT